MKKEVLLLILILLILLPSVHAIGISPPSFTVDFEPNLEDEKTFRIINNIGQDMTADVKVHGQLAPYIKPNRSSIEIAEGQIGDFTFKVKLPEDLEPGLNVGKILVTGIGKTASEGMFNVRTAVEGRYVVRVPFPGKYIDYVWHYSDIKENETAHFSVDVTHRGNTTIDEVYAFIDIFDIEWKRVARVPTTKINFLLPQKSDRLYATWDSTGNAPGLYNIKLTLYYDGIYKEEVGELRIGSLYVRILNYTKTFETDTINKFNVNVQSQWNEKIDNVYAEIKIFNESIDITTIKTPFKSLSPWTPEILEGFWDTRGVLPGEYNVNITAFYSNRATSEAGKIILIKSMKINPYMLLFVGSLILFFMLIILLIYLTKRKKSKKYK